MSLASYLNSAIPTWWELVRSQRPEGKIAVLSWVWSHHAKRSGYQQVSKGLGMVLPQYGKRLVPTRISQWVAGEGLDAAYQIALAMKVTRRDCLLVLNGDDELEFIKNIRRATPTKIYAVFHQPPRVLERRLAKTSRLLLDGALCVARHQIRLVESITPPGKTWFVPHGVDTDYFIPGARTSDRPSVLCVGFYLRDFETLRKAADIIAESVPTVTVRLIAPRDALSSDLNLGRVALVSGLSDEQLLDEYQRAWVILLPLIDSTANNALLESLACGKPIVASNIGGVRDYSGFDCGALCPPGDAEAHAAATISLLRDSTRRGLAGRASRARAEFCAWPKVRKQIRKILEMDSGR